MPSMAVVARMALVGCLLSAGACGSSEGDAAPADAGAKGPCGVYAAALGDAVRTCLGPIQAGAVAARGKAECDWWLRLPGTGATEAGLAACAEAVRSSPCNVSSALLPACQLAGDLADGAQCASPVQCRSRLCVGTTGLCGGVCKARVAIGDKCTPLAQCVDGAGCDESFTCVANGPAGGRCTVEQRPGCQPGLFCEATTKTCKPLPKEGEACSTVCSGWLRCDPTARVCYAPKTVGEGESCGEASRVICASGLGCDPSSGVCGPLILAGANEACGGRTVCREGQCGGGGDLGPSRCPVVIADGAPCSYSLGQCRDAALCLDGTCQRLDQLTCK